MSSFDESDSYIPSKWAREVSPLFDSSSKSSNNFNVLSAVYRDGLAVLQDMDSSSGPRTYHQRDRVGAEEILLNDYFVENAKYGADQFRRRFRMHKPLFLCIVHVMETTYEHFHTTFDAQQQKSFTALQKCTSAIRRLAYGSMADSLDEYLNMSEKTSRESLYNFCYGIFTQTNSKRPRTSICSA